MLHAVAAPEPDPLPEVEHLLRAAPRRPGELHEAVTISPELSGHLMERCAPAGVAIDVAATLLVESQLLMNDLAAVGAGYLMDRLLDAEVGVTRRLSAAEADYLRSLTVGRRSGSTAGRPRDRIVLPVRLLPLLDSAVWMRARDGNLERAIRWETAALLGATTMREWGLRRVLTLADRRR
jgi:hypothetical protein